MALIAITSGDRRLLLHIGMEMFAVDPSVRPIARRQRPLEQRVVELVRGSREHGRKRRARTRRGALALRATAGKAARAHDARERYDGNHRLSHTQRFPSSWNATFTLITARDSGVPPYSMSVSSSSFVKTGNFGFNSAAISSAVFFPISVFAASTSARLNAT